MKFVLVLDVLPVQFDGGLDDVQAIVPHWRDVRTRGQQEAAGNGDVEPRLHLKVTNIQSSNKTQGTAVSNLKIVTNIQLSNRKPQGTAMLSRVFT